MTRRWKAGCIHCSLTLQTEGSPQPLSDGRKNKSSKKMKEGAANADKRRRYKRTPVITGDFIRQSILAGANQSLPPSTTRECYFMVLSFNWLQGHPEIPNFTPLSCYNDLVPTILKVQIKMVFMLIDFVTV